MSQVPSVYTPDVVGAAGMEGASMVAGNLNQLAERAQRAALQKAELDATTKLQKEKLDAEERVAKEQMQAANEQRMAQNEFAKAENQKEREARKESETKRLAFEQRSEEVRNKHNEDVFTFQKESFATQQAQEQERRKLEIEMKREAAARAWEYKSRFDELDQKEAAIDDELVAAEFAFKTANTNEEISVAKMQEIAEAKDATSMALAQNTIKITGDALKGAIRSEAVAYRPSIARQLFDVAVIGATEGIIDPSSNTYTDRTRATGQAVSKTVRSLIGNATGVDDRNVLGLDPRNNAAALLDHTVDRMAPMLAPALGTKVTTPELEAKLGSTLGAAYAIVVNNEGIKGTSTAKEATDDALNAKLDESLKGLAQVTDPVLLQGLADRLADQEGVIEEQLKAAEEAGMSDSDKEAGLKTLEKIQKVGILLQARLKAPEHKAMWYTKKSAEVLPKIVAAYRDTTNSSQFRELAKRWGFTEEEAHKFADIYTEGRKGNTPSVPEAQKRLEALTKEKANLPGRRLKLTSELNIQSAYDGAWLAEESMKREEEAARKRAAAKK